MFTLFSLESFFLLLHLMITSIRLCAATRAILLVNLCERNDSAPLKPLPENISALTIIADSTAEKRGAEGYSVEQILFMSLIVALPIYLIFNLGLIVLRQNGACPRLWLRLNMRPIFTTVKGFFSSHFRWPVSPSRTLIHSFARPASQIVALSLRYTIRYIRRNGVSAPTDTVLPLHQLDNSSSPPPSAPAEHAPSPVLPPRVLFPESHEPHNTSNSHSAHPSPSTSAAIPRSVSQSSLAVSEATCWSADSDAATVVQELIPLYHHLIFQRTSLNPSHPLYSASTHSYLRGGLRLVVGRLCHRLSSPKSSIESRKFTSRTPCLGLAAGRIHAVRDSCA
ncbi:hypothetical protein FB451DRAFT_1206764 [Mycena latifolia]|nr:hypothetical protein FB451DRAFT_1206764 [Mycena latifolia]